MKKIKGKEYAYLVENTWKKRKKAARQKVSKYLGKVVRFDKVKDSDFFSFVGKKPEEYKNTKEGMLKDLIRYELLLRGFSEEGMLLKKDTLIFDLNQKRFIDKGKEKKLVIEMNEGFLCKHTLRKVLSFRSFEEDEREKGIKLAKILLETGLKVPQEIFISFFEKI
ncbi:hypothetical protein GOV09_06255 [Candidatus Woesearchaeota archaeon]|nr:hypothetical protein [Candidatus Woesearchaeota archaeon]